MFYGVFCRSMFKALQIKQVYILCKCFTILLVIYVWLFFVYSTFELNVNLTWNKLCITIIHPFCNTDLASVNVLSSELISSNILVATSTSTVLSINSAKRLDCCCCHSLHVKVFNHGWQVSAISGLNRGLKSPLICQAFCQNCTIKQTARIKVGMH